MTDMQTNGQMQQIDVPAPMLTEAESEAVREAAAAWGRKGEENTMLRKKNRELAESLNEVRALLRVTDLALSEEKNRSRTLQADRDQAVTERAELHVMMVNIKAQMDAFVVPLDPLPSKRRKAAKVVSSEDPIGLAGG